MSHELLIAAALLVAAVVSVAVIVALVLFSMGAFGPDDESRWHHRMPDGSEPDTAAPDGWLATRAAEQPAHQASTREVQSRSGCAAWPSPQDGASETRQLWTCASCGAEGDSASVAGSEPSAESEIQSVIDAAPKPVRDLGVYLGRLLDDDRWPEAERLLIEIAALLAAHPAQDSAQAQGGER